MVAKQIITLLLLTSLLACSPLIPTPGVSVDAQVGKENNSTKQIVASQTNASGGESAAVAGTDAVSTGASLQKDANVVQSAKIGASKATKSKSIVDRTKENTVQAEKVDDIISAEKTQEVSVGANSTVNMIDNSGVPWYILLILLFGVGSVGYWFNIRNKQ